MIKIFDLEKISQILKADFQILGINSQYKVDITLCNFEPHSTHFLYPLKMAMNCPKMMIRLIRKQPLLKKVLIIIKKLLYSKGKNITFYGELNRWIMFLFSSNYALCLYELLSF